MTGRPAQIRHGTRTGHFPPTVSFPADLRTLAAIHRATRSNSLNLSRSGSSLNDG